VEEKSVDYRYLIVGGGMTGDAAAQGIREVDAIGTIGMVSAEPHAPYNRPPLSKGLWKGDPEEKIWRPLAPGTELFQGRRIVSLDVRNKQATDDRGREYRYEKLLLATGGTPRHFPTDSDRIIYFRTYDDYRRLRASASARARIAVIGGGFIGSEVAAAVRLQEADVVMIVPEQGLGARVFPADLSSFLVGYYREKGVETRMGEGVKNIQSRDGKVVISTTTGGEIVADVAVAGLGIVPNTELAKQAGLQVDNGIVVDENLRTSQGDIYAAGDVANFPNPALGTRMRVEHEDNANAMGRAAGRTMAGTATPYRHLPFFYSDLFELGYEAVGDLDPRLDTVSDWKQQFREGVIYYLKDGRVRGVLLWNTWGQVDAARALIAEKGPFTAKSLRGRLSA
jgi:3-phenylpropionate/trans-cinnamate dioxygenase ferredoxin reductase subunit